MILGTKNKKKFQYTKEGVSPVEFFFIFFTTTNYDKFVAFRESTLEPNNF